MVKISEIETNRLILRQWLPSDYLPFSKLNADLDVMKYYPNTLTESESNSFANKIKTLISKRGWGFWAVVLKDGGCFIGFAGLHKPEVDLPFSPCVEIGWRLSKKYWGNGYATEAAKAALEYAFEVLQLNEVVSFTSVKNIKSKSVMERLNMVNVMQNFEHPNIPVGHHLREHVLYKITKAQWLDSMCDHKHRQTIP